MIQVRAASALGRLEVGHELAVEADHAKMSQDRNGRAVDLDDPTKMPPEKVSENLNYISLYRCIPCIHMSGFLNYRGPPLHHPSHG